MLCDVVDERDAGLRTLGDRGAGLGRAVALDRESLRAVHDHVDGELRLLVRLPGLLAVLGQLVRVDGDIGRDRGGRGHDDDLSVERRRVRFAGVCDRRKGDVGSGAAATGGHEGDKGEGHEGTHA